MTNPTTITGPTGRPRGTSAAVGLLRAAYRSLDEAALAVCPGERYVFAHLAALRAAAAVLAARARPDRPGTRRGRPASAWVLLTAVAPEMGEWAAFFAAGAHKRSAAEAGEPQAVTVREADDLVRDAHVFVSLVGATLEPAHQPGLLTWPVAGARSPDPVSAG